MKKKKKIPIWLPIAIAAVMILAIIAGVVVYSNSPAQRLKKQLSLGNRYLSELKYEEAVAAFTTALEIDPADPEAKEALVGAYLTWADSLADSGEIDKACEILERGIAQTGDSRLSDRLTELRTPPQEETEKPAETEAEEVLYQLPEEDREYLLSVAQGEMTFLEGFQAGQYGADQVEAALAAAQELVLSLQNTDRFREICRNWQQNRPNDELNIKEGDCYMIARSYDTDHADINVGSAGNGWFVGSAIQNGFHTLIVAPYVDGQANGTAYFYNTALTAQGSSSMSIMTVTDGVTAAERTYISPGSEPVTYIQDDLSGADWWPDWYEKTE